MFGLFEEVRLDPGSDLTSKVVKQLNAYSGIKHVVCLVDRHTSDRVEGLIKQILKHLNALVQDEQCVSLEISC